MPDDNIFDDDDALDIILLGEIRQSGSHYPNQGGCCLGLVLVLLLASCLACAMILIVNPRMITATPYGAVWNIGTEGPFSHQNSLALSMRCISSSA